MANKIISPLVYEKATDFLKHRVYHPDLIECYIESANAEEAVPITHSFNASWIKKFSALVDLSSIDDPDLVIKFRMGVALNSEKDIDTSKPYVDIDIYPEKKGTQDYLYVGGPLVEIKMFGFLQIIIIPSVSLSEVRVQTHLWALYEI